jgi:hypothetical protein
MVLEDVSIRDPLSPRVDEVGGPDPIGTFIAKKGRISLHFQ